MKFNFMDTKIKGRSAMMPQGDVRLHDIGTSISLEFANSAINKLGITEGSYFRYALNEAEDDAGRVFEEGRYMAFGFFEVKLKGCRRIRTGKTKYFYQIRGKEEMDILREFMRGQKDAEYKLFVDIYSDSQVKEFVIDKYKTWDESKAENYRKKYGGRQ